MKTRSVTEILHPIWEGFVDRFENLWETTKDHYVLMPILTTGIIVAALYSNPFGWALTFAALGLIGYNGHQASTHYFLEGNEKRGLNEFGETAADIMLLGGGFALGKVGQAATQAKSATNAGSAIHLVDEVAAGLLLAKKALQQY